MSVMQVDDKFFTNEGFYVIEPKEQNVYLPHTHDFVEFIYMFRGHCIHIVDGQEFPAQKGDLLFINYNSVHSIRAGTGAVYSDILIKPEFIDESLRGSENVFSLLQAKDFRSFQGVIDPDNRLIHFSANEQKRIEMLISWTCEEEQNRDVGSPLVLRASLNMFLTMVFRKMALPMENRMGMNKTLLSYLKQNCASAMPMAQTAKKSGYSEAYFSRQFKKLTGQTYTDYLTDCRIEKACMLLTQTDEAVDDVIYACGFSDRTKFFKKFREKTGMTPAKFKKTSKLNTNFR